MPNEKNIKLIGFLQNSKEGWKPEDYTVSGAMGCFAEESSSDIHKRHSINQEPYVIGKGEKRKELDWNETKELILKETSGRGHGAVLDQEEFSFSIDNLTRASTLFLCGPEYGEHLQQSLRRADAERGFFEIKTNGANELMKKQFELYEKMQDSGIPSEDARFILPLNTKTTIQSKWNARELMHLYSMAQRFPISEEIKDTVNQMYKQASDIAQGLMKDRKKNLEVLAWRPSPQLFATSNSAIERMIGDENIKILNASGKGLMTPEEIDEAIINRDETLLANMKHYHFEFLVGMSLATFHQATRQRTWNQSVQALPDAVKKREYIIPPSIKETEFENNYKRITEQSIDFVNQNLSDKEALGVLPHSLKVYDLIHIDGWNAIHSIGKRRCNEAQWEIRNFSNAMADKIKEYDYSLGKWAVPQGVTYGDCPEKKSCGICYQEPYNELRKEVKNKREISR